MSLLPYIVVCVLLIIKNSFKQMSIFSSVIMIFTYLKFNTITGSNNIAAGYGISV